ncbi:16S rRNA (cytosine(1402)-N(4))-methyltransferase, partial [Candidatus Nomurabacteria bacterium RIFCSPHIGHO2_12_FULL_37_29]
GDKFKNCNISFVNDNFRNIDKVLVKTKVEEVDGIIFDLGLSSDQLENSGRGFSFLKDEPLLMTMKENPSREDLTAKEIVNTWSEESLADIIHGYGEERFARRIAKGVVETRVKKKIESSFDLVKVINDSVPVAYRMGHLHPATRTFQALRIAVNDELGALKNGLEKGFKFLKKGGRMSVISFHSLEDRIVKRFYKAKEKEEKAKLINKKPFTPSIEEIRNNNRSRSAKLRILERI